MTNFLFFYLRLYLRLCFVPLGLHAHALLLCLLSRCVYGKNIYYRMSAWDLGMVKCRDLTQYLKEVKNLIRNYGIVKFKGAVKKLIDMYT